MTFAEFQAQNDARDRARTDAAFAAKAGISVEEAAASQNAVNQMVTTAIGPDGSTSVSLDAGRPTSAPVSTKSGFNLPVILGVVGILLTVAFALGRK